MHRVASNLSGPRNAHFDLGKPFIEEFENERDQINPCRHHAGRDYSGLYPAHAAAALIAVDTEFTAGIADATEPGADPEELIHAGSTDIEARSRR
jgi:hypothetical protein